MLALVKPQTVAVPLPPADAEILPGVIWGRFDELFTPAFWLTRAWYEQRRPSVTFRLGTTLKEEIVACLLGGHGFPAEVGVAAFQRLRGRDLIGYRRGVELEICAALTEPLFLGNRWVRYRYPNRRARFISGALQRLAAEEAPLSSDVALREWLTTFDGIGLKTASWITRNILSSDNVAILDIHVLRAGVLAGLFGRSYNLTTDYRLLEARMLEFARALHVRLSLLDALIWAEMRALAPLALSVLNRKGSYCSN